MKRLIGLVVLMAATIAGAGPRHAVRHVSKVGSVSPVKRLLDTRVRQVSWDETPLSEVIGWLRKLSPPNARVHILPRWRALEVEGVDKDSPITLELHGATVASILTEVLDQLSSADPLTYVGKGRKLRITTRSDVQSRLTTEMYDVAELLAQAQAKEIQPRFFIGQSTTFVRVTVARAGVGIEPQQLDVGGSLFGGNTQGTQQGGQQNDDDDPDPAEFEADLIDWIQTTVEPDTWQVNGGAGTLAIFDGVLTVRNSADVHALLGGGYHLNR